MSEQVYVLLQLSDFQGAVEVSEVIGVFEHSFQAFDAAQARKLVAPYFDYRVQPMTLNEVAE